jgi:MFS family permease
MPYFKSRFPLTPLMKGALTSSLELGAFFGSLTCSSLADKYSRKWTILLGCIIFLVGATFQAIAQSLWVLFVGRAVGGWGVGMLSCLAPLYMSEISPKELRGSLLSLEQLSIVSGVVIGFWYSLSRLVDVGSIMELEISIPKCPFEYPFIFNWFPRYYLVLELFSFRIRHAGLRLSPAMPSHGRFCRSYDNVLQWILQ